GDAAADHYHLGIEEVDHVRDQDADMMLRAPHHLGHHRIFFLQRLGDHAGGEPDAAVLLHDLEDAALHSVVDQRAHIALHRGAAGERLGAAALAARALRTLGVEDHVADFAGDAARPHVNLA